MLNANISSGCVRRPPKVYPGTNISRKYKMQRVKAREMLRLKKVVPSVAGRKKVSQIEIVEEAANYIDQLHLMLIQRISAIQDLQGKKNANIGEKIAMPTLPVHPDIILNLKNSFSSLLRRGSNSLQPPTISSQHSATHSMFSKNATPQISNFQESRIVKNSCKNSLKFSRPERTNKIQKCNKKIIGRLDENLSTQTNPPPFVYLKN